MRRSHHGAGSACGSAYPTSPPGAPWQPRWAEDVRRAASATSADGGRSSGGSARCIPPGRGKRGVLERPTRTSARPSPRPCAGVLAVACDPPPAWTPAARRGPGAGPGRDGSAKGSDASGDGSGAAKPARVRSNRDLSGQVGQNTNKPGDDGGMTSPVGRRIAPDVGAGSTTARLRPSRTPRARPPQPSVSSSTGAGVSASAAGGSVSTAGVGVTSVRSPSSHSPASTTPLA